MTCHNNIREEKIIDFLLDNVNIEEKMRLREHIFECSDCQKTYNNWALLMAEQDNTPSPHVKERLLKAIKTNKKVKKTVKHFSNVRVRFGVVFASFLIVSLLLIPLFNKQNNDVTQVEPFLTAEETTIYNLHPVVNEPISGYAWINNHSEEMLLLIDGIVPILPNDYQAWIQTQKELKDAGIITINSGKGQLYVKDGTVNQLQHILISKEPKGGSGSPTDPNAFILKLQSR